MGLEQPKVVIVGAGGMGALFGSILQKGGLDVVLYDTNEIHVNAIRQSGLKISGYGGKRIEKLPVTTDLASVDHADIILFQCKSHGTRDAALAARELIQAGAVAISFQNGLGNEDVIAEVAGKQAVLGGLTTMAGYLIEPGHIRDFSRVPSYIGEWYQADTKAVNRAAQIAQVFTQAGLETYQSTHIRTEIWKKLLGNIAMSAVSGATNLTVAECLAVPELKSLSLRALDEALAVARSAKLSLDRSEVIAGMEFISTPGGTGDNKSSLCVDLLNQRPTEVDYIYGTVIAIAEKNSVPVPTLKTLSSIVKGLESHYMEMQK